MKKAIFALGCFWKPEENFKDKPGIIETEVGYAGGASPNVTYEEVCGGNTGHAEVVRLTYDDKLISFKKIALKKGVAEKTFNEVMMNAKFLPKVIEYDRYQPEFYEDTFTYIKKRTNKKKISGSWDRW